MADLADIALCVTAARAVTSTSLSGSHAKYEATEAFDRIETRTIDLETDSPESVAFGDLPSAALVMLQSPGGKVRARLTSADGTLQSVPVDPVAFILSLTVPITAIDLTRVAGSPTVRVSATLGAPTV
jgi:hypothetical protein